MKALYLPMIDLDLLFRYLKGRCHGNQFCANSLEKMLNFSHNNMDLSQTFRLFM